MDKLTGSLEPAMVYYVLTACRHRECNPKFDPRLYLEAPSREKNISRFERAGDDGWRLAEIVMAIWPDLSTFRIGLEPIAFQDLPTGVRLLKYDDYNSLM
jgi:hypothetical protein